MAYLDASALTSAFPTQTYDPAGDYTAAKTIFDTRNALSDIAQERALRPGLAAGDPQALNALSIIDPAAADAQRAEQIANASLPYTLAQNRMALLSKGAVGLLAVPSSQRPAAYQNFLSTLPPQIAGTLPQTYPGDGPTQQMAFAGANPSDAIKYLQTAIVPAGGAPGGAAAPPQTYAGAVAGAESGGNPNATSTTSSAVGQDQFINSTWLQEMKAHRPDLTNGKSDQQILAMRGNPDLSTEMTNDYAQDNAPQLARHSIPITPASLFVAHHFGADGAVDLYAAEANNPQTPVSSVLPPAVIQANPNLAGQTVGTLLGGIRLRMANVPPGSFGADLANTPPITMAQPQRASAAPPASAQATSSQPAASAPPPGITPLYHGDGTPALASNQPGYQLGRDANGNIVPFAMPGGQADPAVLARNKAAQAQASAAAQGPVPGGAAVAPPQNAGNGPFPLPPTDPYAGQNNNRALATQMNDDRQAANKTVEADAPLIQKDLANIQFDQQFHQINADNPTGPNAGGAGADLARTYLPFTPSNAPYQEMKKLSANLQTAALPTNLGRLDLPIIKSVAAQQPTVTNLRQANDNIENIQIAGAQRDIDYRRARGQWVQQFGNLHGFEQTWADYNNAVPTLSWGQGGTVQLAQAQPSFANWVSSRAPGGRYDPSLANVPDNQLPGAQGQPAVQPTMQQAAAPQQGGAVYHVASAADYASVPSGAQYVSPDGVMRVKR